jgi:D-proline reductase (dithiol) PrdB
MTSPQASYAERYAEWIARARPYFAEGNTREAFTGYPYMVNDNAPFAPLRKPLAEAIIFPITSGGLYLPDSQPPFDEPNPEGDHTLQQADLDVKHGHYDPAEALRDYNSVFPLDRLRELAEAGRFAGLTSQGISFMGYVTDAGTFAEGTARSIAQAVQTSGADAAFLTPV